MPRAAVRLFAAVLVLCGVLAPATRLAGRPADTLPERLTDREMWKLSEDFSEANGFFRSDNLLSNELYYPEIMPGLMKQARLGGVYLGVGPEQNFNYIAVLKPKMVFITDIRRGNLHAQLMYKALFEMASDRADFVSKLFTKARPATLTAQSSTADIMNAFWDIPTSSEATYRANLQALKDHLTKRPHALPLSADDLQGIEDVYWAFYRYGPGINYNSSTGNGVGGGRGSMANYHQLMVAADDAGVVQSYLASEASFKVLKDLEERNLVVPVVGNFGGPKALRAVGKYVRDHGAVVSAFYLSNVEQYLHQDGIFGTFCGNVASMPLDERSTFIRSGQGGFGGGGGGLRNSIGLMLDETRGCLTQ